MIDFNLHLLREPAQLCKFLRVGSSEDFEIAQFEQSADDEMERAIEPEDGLINPEPFPAGKIGFSHDAPHTCVNG